MSTLAIAVYGTTEFDHKLIAEVRQCTAPTPGGISQMWLSGTDSQQPEISFTISEPAHLPTRGWHIGRASMRVFTDYFPEIPISWYDAPSDFPSGLARWPLPWAPTKHWPWTMFVATIRTAG